MADRPSHRSSNRSITLSLSAAALAAALATACAQPAAPTAGDMSSASAAAAMGIEGVNPDHAATDGRTDRLPPALRPAPAAASLPAGGAAGVPPASPPVAAVRRADFGAAAGRVSADARRVADWVAASGDNGTRDIVIVDKRAARVYVLDRQARLEAEAPALLGAARGDHTVPGIGDRPLAQVKAHEKTTPAGRFVAEPGVNTNGEDVVWVDYDAAVSMHRVRTANPAERRLARLATPGVADNRISFGCINLPVAFYETQLRPRVHGGAGAVVYVLPEVWPLQRVFALRAG